MPGLPTVLREWGRIGCVGFGGPPTHIALLRELCVERRGWLTTGEFEDAVAACNLLPGPSSTQLAILCGWRVAGPRGALAGGAAFVLPGLALILALAALFLGSPPDWVRGAGAGAGAAVAAVAVHAGWRLVGPSRERLAQAPREEPLDRAPQAGEADRRGPLGRAPRGGAADREGPRRGGARPEGAWRRGTSRRRWAAYVLAGGVAAAVVGPWLVLVIVGCGVLELGAQRRAGGSDRALGVAPLAVATAGGGTALALAWVALKVGALSYGGGFVIVPLMQGDAVDRHQWMTAAEFAGAVALGQITPGPVLHTVAVVGYAAAGVGGGLLAAAVAFAPSFAFVLLGARHFDALRGDRRARAFLDGAGPAAVGAILGSAVPLARALAEPWQFAVLAAAAVALLALRRGVVPTLLGAGSAGVAVALAGGPLP